MKIEYLIIFQSNGIPVYSKCFGGFCAKLNYDETLMSGFLSALTSMPQAIGGADEIQNLEMGYTKFHFKNVPATEQFIVIGINKESITEETEGALVDAFSKIAELLTSEYRDVDWNIVPRETLAELEQRLFSILGHCGNSPFEDTCAAADNCPLHTIDLKDEERKKTIWEVLRTRYSFGAVRQFVRRNISRIFSGSRKQVEST